MNIKEFIFNTSGVEIYQVDNFLTPIECEYLCQYIDEHSKRSAVAGDGQTLSTYSTSRTSHTVSFLDNNPTINAINKKMADEVGSPITYAEPLQGHVYQEGQEFKDHNDFFTGDGYINHCLSSGQRTWTLMVYLNDVEAGGHTEFPEIGRSFAPKRGTAVIWKNSDGKGTENHATLHCGLPVLKGKKYIVTKWFREFPFIFGADAKLAKAYHQKQGQVTPVTPKKTVSSSTPFLLDKLGNKVDIQYKSGVPHAHYKSNNDIPAFTSEGFAKIPIPKSLYHQILIFYYRKLEDSKPEFDPNGNSDLKNYISSQEVSFPTEVIPLTKEMIALIFDGLENTLTDWIGKSLLRTYCYGIRRYKRGAELKKHIDGFQTRIISAILNIDQKVEEPWALQIDDHQGKEHEVFLQPGEMILYESAVLSHGRVKPFKGEYYTNLFVHYIPIEG